MVSILKAIDICKNYLYYLINISPINIYILGNTYIMGDIKFSTN